MTTGRFGDVIDGVISGTDLTSVRLFTSSKSVSNFFDFLGITRNGELSEWRSGEELDSETIGEFSTSSTL